jgi:hypothetical protein
MRVLAETIRDVESRAIMLRLAADYDKLADRGILLADSEAPKKKKRQVKKKRRVRLAARRRPA